MRCRIRNRNDHGLEPTGAGDGPSPIGQVLLNHVIFEAECDSAIEPDESQ